MVPILRDSREKHCSICITMKAEFFSLFLQMILAKRTKYCDLFLKAYEFENVKNGKTITVV